MKARYLDLLERTFWTFVQAALAVWIATDADLFSKDALEVAGVAGAIAVAKCLVAFRVGSPNTAATMPAGPDTDMGGEDGRVDPLYAVLVVLVVVAILVILGVL